MAIYKLERRGEALMTMKFRTYNAAVEFSNKSGMMKGSKPYKRTVLNRDGETETVWCVTYVANPQAKSVYRLAA